MSPTRTRKVPIATHTVLWPDERRGPWQLTVYMQLRSDYVLVPVGMELTSWRGPMTPEDAELPDPSESLPQLTDQTLKAVPFGGFARDARRAWIDALDDHGLALLQRRVLTAAQEQLAKSLPGEVSQLRDNQHRHGRDLGDDHYRQVAEIYLDPRNADRPTQAVADHFHLSKSGAAKQVARARGRGLLPPSGGRGRARPVI